MVKNPHAVQEMQETRVPSAGSSRVCAEILKGKPNERRSHFTAKIGIRIRNSYEA